MADEQKPVFKHHLLRNSKMQLRTPSPNASGKWANLRYDMFRENPRIVVRTNDPEDQDKDYGQITAAMDPMAFMMFLDQFEEVIKGTIPSFNFQCNGKARGDTSGDIIHKTDIWVGRDKDGIMSITVIAKDDATRPVIKFPYDFADTRFHKIFHKSGVEYTLAERSTSAARGHLCFLREVIPHLMVADWTPPPPNPNYTRGANGAGGGYNKGGGGYNRGGQRNGSNGGSRNGGNYAEGGQAVMADDPESIPF